MRLTRPDFPTRGDPVIIASAAEIRAFFDFLNPVRFVMFQPIKRETA